MHYEKFQDGTAKCIEDEIPFELPEGWAWARIFSITEDLPYGTAKKSMQTGLVAVLRMGNIQSGEIDYSDLVYSSDIDDIAKYTLIKNDLLFNRTNSAEWVGKTAIYRGNIPAMYAGYLIRMRAFIDSEYLNVVMNSGYAKAYCNSVKTDGVNQSNINAQKLGNFLVPIPSPAEQKRISTNIVDLIPRISMIQREKEHIAELILQTKAKILDLAIHGKLVPQNPDDEPASVLMERIRAEKEELIKQGKIKRDKKESIIFKGEDNSYYEKIGSEVRCIDEEIPFDIPDTWEWVRLENCCSKEIRRGKSPKYIDESGILVFAQKCNTKYNGIDIDLALYLDESTLGRYPTNEYMQDGDIVVNSTGTGTLGRVGFYRTSDNHSGLPIVPDSHITIIRGFSCIQAFYLYAFMKANQGALEKKGEGSTNQKELKPLTLKEMLVPLPPVSEQKRIETAVSAAFSLITLIERGLS
ncbi:restriction endonuclease subunit S [Mediterraneibacter gnavus]|uniref:restriction endonuclease subunit S n=1 Tax=Mediterraneibacter gnavus TaxID=33038 RepID=UPI001A9ACC5A|nr:restriction endonuclease subunit S [Mediterraneibacter gnavus]